MKIVLPFRFAPGESNLSSVSSRSVRDSLGFALHHLFSIHRCAASRVGANKKGAMPRVLLIAPLRDKIWSSPLAAYTGACG